MVTTHDITQIQPYTQVPGMQRHGGVHEAQSPDGVEPHEATLSLLVLRLTVDDEAGQDYGKAKEER